jgi:dienelactone hydrolase
MRPVPDFRAAVAFYPYCSLYRLTVPTLVLIGGADTWTPAFYCQFMEGRHRSDAPPLSLVVYPGAHHSFDEAEISSSVRFHGNVLAYDPAATADAQRRVREFFARWLR